MECDVLSSGAVAGAGRDLGNPQVVARRATCRAIRVVYTGLVISIWPYVLPPGLTIWDAAAPPQSLGFALVGALFIIPFILGYSAWSDYVFRGKVKVGEGYH